MKNVLLTRRVIKNSERCSLFLILVCGVLLFGLSACEQANHRSLHLIEGATMGTTFEISVVASGQFDAQAIRQGVLEVLENVNQSMSTYVDESEVSKINNSPADVVISISDDLRAVLEEAQSISQSTHGAFDITLGPVVDLWGFGANGAIQEVPSDTQLNDLKISIGFEKLKLDPEGVVKLDGATQIDLSAIAKGFAVDKVAEYLLRSGLNDFLVNVGGELKARGLRADGNAWKVGIEKPKVYGGVQQVVELQNQAIATSGDYRNFAILDGTKYSHTIDIQTLKPIFHRLASVSVIHENASTADALATALLAMGEVRALEFSNRHLLSTYLIVRDGEDGAFKVLLSDQFNDLLP